MPTFDADYMARRMFISWRAPIVAAAIVEVLDPKVAIDVGCATGDIVAGLVDLGVDAWGTDSSKASMSMVPTGKRIITDATVPWIPAHKFGLAICFEVFSILPEVKRDAVLQNLTTVADTILANHIDLAPGRGRIMEDWALDVVATDRFREILEPWIKKQAIKAIARTAQVWRRN